MNDCFVLANHYLFAVVLYGIIDGLSRASRNGIDEPMPSLIYKRPKAEIEFKHQYYSFQLSLLVAAFFYSTFPRKSLCREHRKL